MTTAAILKELQALGNENYKQLLFRNYGVKEPCYGVKIGDLKKIQKRIKMDYKLALELYDTGNYDAMYLAGLIADDARMTKRDLERWVAKAYAGSLPGATVPWVAAGGRHGWEVALKWIDSSKPLVASAGWDTLGGIVAIRSDETLDIPALKKLLTRVQKEIHSAPDTVRYSMNTFVICVGCYVAALTPVALQASEKIGPVSADLGNNDCQIPSAAEYIAKVQKRGAIGRKRKTVKC